MTIGKPLGISQFALLTARWMTVDLPAGVTAQHIIGAGCLGGIGFIMALFISGLSFSHPELIEFSKLGIIAASLISALAGVSVLLAAKVPDAGAVQGVGRGRSYPAGRCQRPAYPAALSRSAPSAT